MNHHQQQQKAKQASGSSSSTRIIKAKLSSASTQLLLPTTQAQLLTTTTPRVIIPKLLPATANRPKLNHHQQHAPLTQPRTLSSTSNHTYNHHKSPSSTCSSSISFNSATRSPPPLPLPPPNHELTNNRLPRLEKLHSHQSLSIPSSSTSNQTATTSTPTTAHIDRAPSSSPPTDTYDHARVNRKILDLEISNASLLAINGALERTKVKQQTEIRKLKGKLTPRLAGAGEAGSTVSETGSTSSSSNTSTLLNQLLISPSVDDDNEDVDLDTLVSEDPQFMEIIKSIESLINQAHNAIAFNPASAIVDGGAEAGGTIKTKVLNPFQIELIRRNSILPPSVQEQEDDVE
ncbi:hypothetical protein Pst134EA_015517 [Puccinia striiformis f. sp. tritici]|uniref:hypothetical protein n=1 Tax=Puccinia striiformis f. sp. tritici TaxID=168172 RepID=UPI002008663D|nr:hypothetical protein Pst134EA_015517 [Puccinia striiformis f. sp. tritici]KAH9463434.1 hypothetical protein Pst134EA_015517 [Puccinia striiformis f. sp. tritici]